MSEETEFTSSNSSEAPPATIAERVEKGREIGSHANGAIVPFPPGLSGNQILYAQLGRERQTIERLIRAGYEPTIYEYRSSGGEIIQAVLRFDHPTEPKEIRPLRYLGKSKNGGSIFWMTAIDGQRPLYGLDRLAARPMAPVLIVEGEKAADAAAKLFPEHVTITWMSGASSVHRAEMVDLAGRNITLWPDNDEPGRKAMRKFAAFAFRAGAASISMVDVPNEFGEKWDLADELPADVATAFPFNALIRTARNISPSEVAHLADDMTVNAEPRRLLGHKPGYSRVDIAEATTALNVLDPNMHRNAWIRVARAVFYAYGEAGLEIFDDWSKSSTDKYREGEPAKLWADFSNEPNFRADPLFWLFDQAAATIKARHEDPGHQAKPNVTLNSDAIWLASIEHLNESHAIVIRGGKAAVLWEHFDPRFGRYTQTYLSKRDFVDRHVRQLAVPRDDEEGDTKKVKRISRGAAWFGSTRRRSYDDVIFAPGKQLSAKFLNLWQGFAVNAADDPDGWSRLKQHLFDHVANGDEASYRYLLDWMAFAVQHLDKPVGTALVLIGKKGAGKSIITEIFGRLFGQHAFVTSRMDDVLGRFNDKLEITSLLGLEEAVAPGNRSADGVLKDLLTRTTLRLEGKFFGVWSAPNYLRVIITSNNEHVVRADGSERRYAVFEVTNPHQSDPVERRRYFGQIIEQMENGGYEAMLGELLNRDIAHWNPESIPETDALKQQKLLSLLNDPVQMYLSDRLTDGICITGHEGRDVPIYEWSLHETVMVPARVLAQDFHAFAEKNGLKATGRQLSLGLARYMPKGFASKTLRGERGDTSNKPYKAYPFPPLEEARKLFERASGIEIPREIED
ncbi:MULTISPECIES: DUF5906 domain-containing protein [unclassified Sphingopyxis]|uniref:DUF5906 domain-containing protein n=1 Tax=unclassified Sphingopyxis TaxID=2614943 RepID=UPI0028637A0C|nr:MULTISPECIES: DUF5906 domain-containing protein [unclassified Sphingopyxis]MDR6833602.1 hypothetical protein [Sphingopyxis sp. BE122]MDR7225871.1 hypothetical protein [Sphingopyxis sp. BE259]